MTISGQDTTQSELKASSGPERAEPLTPAVTPPAQTAAQIAEIDMLDLLVPIEEAKLPEDHAPTVNATKNVPTPSKPKVHLLRGDQPAVHPPKVDTEEVYTAKAEAPKVNTSVNALTVDSPKTATPAAGACEAKTLNTDVSKADLPKPDPPIEKAESSRAATPRVDKPRTDTSEVTTPKVDRPTLDVPRADEPKESTSKPTTSAPTIPSIPPTPAIHRYGPLPPNSAKRLTLFASLTVPEELQCADCHALCLNAFQQFCCGTQVCGQCVAAMELLPSKEICPACSKTAARIGWPWDCGLEPDEDVRAACEEWLKEREDEAGVEAYGEEDVVMAVTEEATSEQTQPSGKHGKFTSLTAGAKKQGSEGVEDSEEKKQPKVGTKRKATPTAKKAAPKGAKRPKKNASVRVKVGGDDSNDGDYVPG